MLNDESTTVEIRGMKVQIVGVDYRDYNDKTEGIMKDVFSKIEFLDDAALRIVLLHDPTSFKCNNTHTHTLLCCWLLLIVYFCSYS